MKEIWIRILLFIVFFLVLLPWTLFPWMSGEGLITKYNAFAFVILILLIIILIYPKTAEYISWVNIPG